MSYRESPAPLEAAATVECVWTQQVSAPEQRVVPDGCVDVIWLDSGRLTIAGTDTGAVVEQLEVGDHATGVRLRPGAAAAVLHHDASELRDQRVDAREVMGPDVADRLAETLRTTPRGHRTDVLLQQLDVAHARPDHLVRHATDLLGAPGTRVGEVADDLGISERQLHRRMVSSVGYGAKTFARVARLRRLAADPVDDLALRALRCGYASQAHMTTEVRRLTGLTPTAFLT